MKLSDKQHNICHSSHLDFDLEYAFLYKENNMIYGCHMEKSQFGLAGRDLCNAV